MKDIDVKPAPIKEYYIAYFDLLGYKEFFRTKPEQVEQFLEDINLASEIQKINDGGEVIG